MEHEISERISRIHIPLSGKAWKTLSCKAVAFKVLRVYWSYSLLVYLVDIQVMYIWTTVRQPVQQPVQQPALVTALNFLLPVFLWCKELHHFLWEVFFIGGGGGGGVEVGCAVNFFALHDVHVHVVQFWPFLYHAMQCLCESTAWQREGPNFTM